MLICTVCRNQYSSVTEYKNHEGTDCHKTNLQARLDKFKPGDLVCKACYVAVNCTENWKNHLNGTRHIKTVISLTQVGKDHKWELPALFTIAGLQFNENKDDGYGIDMEAEIVKFIRDMGDVGNEAQNSHEKVVNNTKNAENRSDSPQSDVTLPQSSQKHRTVLTSSEEQLIDTDLVIIGVNCIDVIGPSHFKCELCDEKFEDSTKHSHLTGLPHMMNVLWNWDPDSATKIRHYETINYKTYRLKCLEAAKQVEQKELKLLSEHQQKIKLRLLGSNIQEHNSYFRDKGHFKEDKPASLELTNEELKQQLKLLSQTMDPLEIIYDARTAVCAVDICKDVSTDVKEYLNTMMGKKPDNVEDVVAQLKVVKKHVSDLLVIQELVDNDQSRKRNISQHTDEALHLYKTLTHSKSQKIAHKTRSGSSDQPSKSCHDVPISKGGSDPPMITDVTRSGLLAARDDHHTEGPRCNPDVPRGGHDAPRSRGGHNAPQSRHDAPMDIYDDLRGGHNAPQGAHHAPRGIYDHLRGGHNAPQGAHHAPRGIYDDLRDSHDAAQGALDAPRSDNDAPRHDGSTDGYNDLRDNYNYEAVTDEDETPRYGYGSHRGDHCAPKCSYDDRQPQNICTATRSDNDATSDGYDSHRVGYTAPRGGNDGPRAGNNTLRAKHDAPRGGYAGPRGNCETPRAGHHAHRGDNDAPNDGHDSPKLGYMAPRGGNDGPRVGNDDPRSKHDVPRGGYAGPRGSCETPRAGHHAHRGDNGAPSDGHDSPKVGYMAPRGGNDGPRVGNDTPRSKHDVPRGGYAGPRGSCETPRAGHRGHRGDNGAPSDGYDSPKDGYMAPRGGNDGHRFGNDTPRSKHDFPRGGFAGPRGSCETPRARHHAHRGGNGAPRGGYDSPRGGYDVQNDNLQTDSDNSPWQFNDPMDYSFSW